MVRTAGGFGRAQGHERESEIDRHAPVHLLLEAIGMNAREGFHQGALSVVDVGGRMYRCTPFCFSRLERR